MINRKLFDLDINIGDFTEDRHRMNRVFRATYYADENQKDAYETLASAWVRAQELYPILDPFSYCFEYEDSYLPQDVIAGWKEVGYDIRDSFGFDCDDWDGDIRCFERIMAEIVVRFFNLGDPDLRMALVPRESFSRWPSMSGLAAVHNLLPRYYARRGNIGYGLFS